MDEAAGGVDTRLTDLEVKVAFLEHSLAELDGVLRETRDALELALTEVRALREQGPLLGKYTPDDEVPPHY